MLLQKQEVSYNPTLYLSNRISESELLNLSLKDFDKDGFEVPAPLEQAYYRANNINLNTEIQYHVAPVKCLYIDVEDSDQELVLDHCMLLERYGFIGPAKSQLINAIEQKPIVQKLLSIVPKWGVDFSLDYITPDICMEVIHIEQDFHDYDEAVQVTNNLQKFIEGTDWLEGAKELIKCKDVWAELSSDDHSDYKAEFFGWHRAFDTYKVFKT